MAKFENQCLKTYWVKRAGIKVKKICHKKKGHFWPCSW